MNKPQSLDRLSPELDAICRQVDVSTRRLFSTMFGVRVDLVGTQVCTDSPGGSDVTGMVNLETPGLRGAMVVSFPKETIFAVLSRTYGQNFTELNKSVRDGVGEITNVLFGMIKRNLNADGYIFKMSLPTVVVIGAQHEIWTSDKSEGQALTFSSPGGQFTVFVMLESEASAQKAG